MSLEIFTFEQGTPEWFAARAGIPTASEFDTVMAKSRGGGGRGESSKKYMRTLLGEVLTGTVQESYSNAHMQRGTAMEPQAREMYALLHDDADIKQVGFMRNGRKGASPDSLVGTSGLLEIKTKLPHLQIEVLLAGTFPVEHKAQVQGQLLISEREFCDFMSYWPGLPPFIVRVYRDEQYMQTLSSEIDRFNDELDEMRIRIEAMS